MVKILVIDDEIGMREGIKDTLVGKGYSVFLATDGLEAKQMLEKNTYDLVISDLRMPRIAGVELLKWFRGFSNVPVILITGHADILETQQAHELGANDFLMKPFGANVLITSVTEQLARHKDKSPPQLDDLYCRIPLRDFVSTAQITIGIHIRLSPTKYVRISHEGDPITLDRLEYYKSKGVHYLYARKEEFGQLIDFNLKLLKALQPNTKIEPARKARFLQYTHELLMEHVLINGIDNGAFLQSKEFIETCVSMVCESDRVFELLETLRNHGEWLYAHSLGVSIYSTMIGSRMGWKTHKTLFKLAAAGLFHDVGSKEIEPTTLEKGRHLLNHTERGLYETHPTRSREILEAFEEIPSDIIQVVYEHHEDYTGHGFPRKLKKEKIHPLAKVISVADRFCYYTVKGPHCEGLSAQRALAKMTDSSGDRVDPQILAALRQVCVS